MYFAVFFLRCLIILIFVLVIKGLHVPKALVVGDPAVLEPGLLQQLDHGTVFLKGINPQIVTGCLEMGNDELTRALAWDSAHAVNDLVRQVVIPLTAL